jgi:hypothetical protein
MIKKSCFCVNSEKLRFTQICRISALGETDSRRKMRAIDLLPDLLKLLFRNIFSVKFQSEMATMIFSWCFVFTAMTSTKSC